MTTPHASGPPGSPPPGRGGQQPSVPFPPVPPGQPPSGAQPPAASGAPATGRPPAGQGIRMFTAGTAVVALLVALAALVVSWRANSHAGEALDKAGAPVTAPPAATAPATTEPATEEPAPTDPAADGTPGAPELNAQTRYNQKYTNESLRISPLGCGEGGVDVDLDEPRVRAETGKGEFTFAPSCASNEGPQIEFADGVRVSTAESESVLPTECADLIRTSALSTGDQHIRTGQVYCVNTSLNAARSAPTTWKMVVLSVTAIAQDGTVTFKASAWDIPV